jgi:hypothetical protein
MKRRPRMRKIRIKIAFLVFLILPYIVYGQGCLDTSGQTISFTLAPGAKASWNNSIAGILQQPTKLSNTSWFLMYKFVEGKILFKVPTFENALAVSISLFRINGKKILNVNMTGRNIGEFNAKLANGIYYARLYVNNKFMGSFRILVGR